MTTETTDTPPAAPAVGAQVDLPVRPRAWADLTQDEGGYITTDAERCHDGLVPLYDAKTLWNACARAGEVERERWKTALTPVMFADFKCWHQNADAELPEVAAWVIQNLRDRLAEYEGPNAKQSRATRPEKEQP